YDRDQFRRDSVDLIAGGHWGERFDRELGRSDVVTSFPRRLERGGVAYVFANRLLHGLATIRAQHLETGMTFLAVWDRHAGDGPGGTADIVNYWRDLGHAVEIIDLERLRNGESPEHAWTRLEGRPHPPSADVEPSWGGMQVLAVLMVRVVNFGLVEES